MKQQTAVEWLFNHFELYYKLKDKFLLDDWNFLMEQAKQIEKKQILDAICANQNGLLRRKNVLEAINYYNENFNPGTGETEHQITMEQKNNSGSLYKNRKEKPTQPDYNGTATIDGKQYRMSGWVNKSKAGTNYLRVLFTEQQPQDLNATAGQATMPMQPQNSQQNIDSVILDDLPF